MLNPVELTSERLYPTRIIAKGRRIRDVQCLIETYGGQTSKWTKRAGPVFVLEHRLYEIHWYEQHGVGSFEHKIVRKDGIPR